MSTFNILKAFVSIVGIFIALYGIYSYIDWRIDHKINNPEFIRKIALNVRPAVIFNSQESIEIDMGAMQFIENIKVIPSNDPRFPKEIIISPKEYLAHAPSLSTLDEVEFSIKVERGKKFDWLYHLHLEKYFSETKMSRFRLELVR